MTPREQPVGAFVQIRVAPLGQVGYMCTPVVPAGTHDRGLSDGTFGSRTRSNFPRMVPSCEGRLKVRREYYELSFSRPVDGRIILGGYFPSGRCRDGRIVGAQQETMRNWAGGRRAFGETGLVVSALGMGCGRLGSALWQGRSDSAATAAVALALDLGVSFFDTADVYGRGRSERLLGKTLRGRRGAVVIATKCGFLKTPATFVNAASAAWGDTTSRHGGLAEAAVGFWRAIRAGRFYAAEYVKKAVVSSLRRLGTDYIDALLLHSPPSEILVQDWVPEVFHLLCKGGEIRCWGVSARTDEDALSALDIEGIGCLEIPLDLCRAAPLDTVIPRAAAGGIAVIIRQPFSSGALLHRRQSPGEAASRTDLASGSDIGVLTTRACLQFALQAPGVSTVIPGMTRPEHVRQNVAFADSQPLPRDDIQSIRDRICRNGLAGSHSV